MVLFGTCTPSPHLRHQPDSHVPHSFPPRSVWLCVDALTCRSTANAVRNYVTSGGPISAGCRLWWKRMKRRSARCQTLRRGAAKELREGTGVAVHGALRAADGKRQRTRGRNHQLRSASDQRHRAAQGVLRRITADGVEGQGCRRRAGDGAADCQRRIGDQIDQNRRPVAQKKGADSGRTAGTGVERPGVEADLTTASRIVGKGKGAGSRRRGR